MAQFDPVAATAAYLATMSPDAHAKAEAYTQGGHWLMLWGFLVGVLVAWLIVRSGILSRLRERIDGARRRPWLASLAVSAAYLLVSWALALPWSLYANWHREKAYGLNNQTWIAWLGESAMATAIGVVFGSLFLMLLYALIRKARRTWWIWGAGLAAAFSVAALVASPIVIEPLFNKYTPAPPGAVRDAVVELAHQTGTPDDKIFIYDGSRQSDRYTANVSGLFGSARVALSDTMFKKQADMSEIRGVVGHEMGHYIRGHILWSIGLMVFASVAGFFLADRLFPLFRRLLGADRVRDISDPAGLPVLAVILSVLGLLFTPIANTVSRAMEADADHFSMIHAHEPDGMAKALIKTAEYRAPSPGWLEEFVFYTHPSVENRIRRAMEYKAHMIREGRRAPSETMGLASAASPGAPDVVGMAEAPQLLSSREIPIPAGGASTPGEPF